MYFIYNILLNSLTIIFSPIILISFYIKPKLRAGFREKIGFYKKNNSGKKTVWIHAVSVGEVNAVESLVKKLYQELSDISIILTTVTKTGQEVAIKKLTQYTDMITYFPYDFNFSVNSAIKALKPDIVVIAETEIWPNFSRAVSRKKLPLIIINGRISEKSYKGYKKIKFFLKNIFKNYSLLLMQTKEDKNRIVKLGANSNEVEVMGNLKFQIDNIIDENEINKLKTSLNISDNRVFIAGSTHKGEDEIIMDVFQKLKTKLVNIKLILAPRHPERNKSVTELAVNKGFTIGLRSQNDTLENKDIILIDTMGELGKLYSVADIAFIGGSFSGTGGHNPLEAAVYKVPVVSGESVKNFKDIYKYMCDVNSAIIVKNEVELYNEIFELFKNKKKYSEMSRATSKIFEQHSGAVEFAFEKIKKFL